MDRIVGLQFAQSIGKFIFAIIFLWWASTSLMPWTIEVIHVLTAG